MNSYITVGVCQYFTLLMFCRAVPRAIFDNLLQYTICCVAASSLPQVRCIHSNHATQPAAVHPVLYCCINAVLLYQRCVAASSQVRFIGSNHVTSHELLQYTLCCIAVSMLHCCGSAFCVTTRIPHSVAASFLPQVRFIGSNHVTSHELLSFNVVWLGLQAWELLMWLKARTTTAQFARAIGTVLLTAVGSVVGGVVLLTLTGGALTA
jgi:hypothetical protein